jgi:hypothetical protein
LTAWRRWVGPVVGATCLLVSSCAPVEPPPPDTSQSGPYIRGSYDEAARALYIHLPRPSYLPAEARLREVDYSPRFPDHWAAQRYEVGAHLLYVIVELSETPIQAPAERELLIRGRPAILSPLRRPDGGVGDWRVLWRVGPTLYTVGGDLPAEEVIAVAAGLR